ncbi:unnamed protein product [Tenebrio molitor]|nr:unnamed protein product [Tenebrio molitor]
MPRKVVICLVILLSLLHTSKYYINGLKCELKGMVNNRVQCVLHDRGINAEEAAENINGSLSWIRNIRKADEKVDLNEKKYPTGLDCNKTFYKGDILDDFKNHIRSTVPVARWCGEGGGETAMSYDDLGSFVRLDNCCKKHETCVSVIDVKESKYELVNNGLLKRFHCSCEKEFHACLKDVNSVLSNKIGFTYFTIFGPQCFREDDPIINCSKKEQ